VGKKQTTKNCKKNNRTGPTWLHLPHPWGVLSFSWFPGFWFLGFLKGWQNKKKVA
jgi:hypothetical protein